MRLLAFTILFTPILFGQQLFFDNTLTGLSASYCYSADNYAYNNTGNFIISAGSHFDFGISFSKSTVNEPPLTMNGIMPNISYTFRKQGRLGGVRLLVGFIAADINHEFSSKKYQFETKGPLLSASVGIPIIQYGNFALLIIPGITWTFLSVEGTAAEDSKGVSLELPLRYMNGSTGFFLNPGIGASLDSDTVLNFSISGGFLLNFTKKIDN